MTGYQHVQKDVWKKTPRPRDWATNDSPDPFDTRLSLLKSRGASRKVSGYRAEKSKAPLLWHVGMRGVFLYVNASRSPLHRKLISTLSISSPSMWNYSRARQRHKSSKRSPMVRRGGDESRAPCESRLPLGYSFKYDKYQTLWNHAVVKHHTRQNYPAGEYIRIHATTSIMNIRHSSSPNRHVPLSGHI